MPSLNRASTLIADDRASGRYRLLLQARAGEAEAGGIAVTLHDLSRSGLLFEADATIERDAEIMLDIPGIGPVAARPVWTNGSFYGAEFAKPLTPDHLKAALSESRVVWPQFARSLDVEQITLRRAPPGEEDTQPGTEAPALDGIEDEGRNAWSGHAEIADPDPKFSLPVRIRIIVGLTLALWSAIFAFLWFAFD